MRIRHRFQRGLFPQHRIQLPRVQSKTDKKSTLDFSPVDAPVTPATAVRPYRPDAWMLPVFMFLLLAGTAAGAIVCRSDTATSWMADFTEKYLLLRRQKLLGTVFWNTLEPLLLLDALLLLFGGCLAGGLLIPMLLFLDGLGLGLALGFLYQSGSQQNLLCALVLILPHGCLTGLILILQARESIKLSWKMAGQLLPGKNDPLLQSPWKACDGRLFAMRSAVLLCGFTACALLNAVLSLLVL